MPQSVSQKILHFSLCIPGQEDIIEASLFNQTLYENIGFRLLTVRSGPRQFFTFFAFNQEKLTPKKSFYEFCYIRISFVLPGPQVRFRRVAEAGG